MKILKCKKALSPVVASIILIAVTVAVSIAVAAWMGALTFTFMKTEQLEIQGCVFVSSPTKGFNMTVQNTGTADLTVDKAKIGLSATQFSITSVLIPYGQTKYIWVYSATYTNWVSGTTYDIYIITSTGKLFLYRATAP